MTTTEIVNGTSYGFADGGVPLPSAGIGAWVPASEMSRVQGELERVRAALDGAERRAASAETRAGVAEEAGRRLRVEDADRNQAAREWADNHGFCSVFEDFCDEFGWEGRRNDYEVTVKLSVEVVVSVDEVPRGEVGCSYLSDRIDGMFTSGELLELARDSGDTPTVEVLNWDES